MVPFVWGEDVGYQTQVSVDVQYRKWYKLLTFGNIGFIGNIE